MNKEDLIEYKKRIAELSDKEKKLRDLYLKQLADGTLQGPPVGYPSVDKPWLKYYTDTIFDNNDEQCSMFQMIEKYNYERLNKTALELRTSSNNFDGGIKISYKSFFKEIKKTAAALTKMGVKPNDIVPTILPNIPESRILIYALNYIGATVYPINFMLPASSLESIINENSVNNIFVFNGFYGKFSEMLNDNINIKKIVTLDGLESLPKVLKTVVRLKDKKNDNPSPKCVKYDKFISAGFDATLSNPYFDKNHIAVIIGTSGTTGTPKGVCLTDENMNSMAEQIINGKIFNQEDLFLDVLIQSIGYGISVMHFSTCLGFHSIIIPELVTDKTSELLCKIRPDNFLGGPVHCINVAKSKQFADGVVPYLDNFISGGASLDKTVELKLNENCLKENNDSSKIFVRQGYGATEAGGCASYALKGSYKFGGIGVPLPYETISVFKLNSDEELTFNSEGEICISGPTIMQNYLNNECETNQVLKVHSDGTKWLHLADIGCIDNDGQIYHHDRVKNIFMRTGFNVHPSKIKDYINSLPMVKECEVIGYSHPAEQTVPVAFIELEDDYKNKYSKKEILDFLKDSCYKNMDEIFLPAEWIIVEKMPINLGGKIDSSILKKQYPICFDENSNDKVLNIKK